MGKTVLEVRDLVASFRIDKKEYPVLRGISFDVHENETFAWWVSPAAEKV